jgi:hypothetical protein
MIGHDGQAGDLVSAHFCNPKCAVATRSQACAADHPVALRRDPDDIKIVPVAIVR